LGAVAYGSEDRIRVLDYEKTAEGGYILSQDMAFWLEEQFGTLKGSRVGVIIIDPGHGGRDPGALGKIKVGDRTITLAEKDITLKVGIMLAQMLRESFPDKRVVLTREADEYPTLDERVEIAHRQELNDRETILFISIHVNASFNTRAKGFEVWHIPREYNRDIVEAEYLDEDQRSLLPILNNLIDREYKTESIRLAQILSQSMEDSFGDLSPNRGLKEEAWFVVRKAKMPAVLLELGFITNAQEGHRLSQRDYLMQVTQGLYNGLEEYIQTYEAGF
jgi:N-acetylmuramoyl-L-alanine amidase